MLSSESLRAGWGVGCGVWGIGASEANASASVSLSRAAVGTPAAHAGPRFLPSFLPAFLPPFLPTFSVVCREGSFLISRWWVRRSVGSAPLTPSRTLPRSLLLSSVLCPTSFSKPTKLLFVPQLARWLLFANAVSALLAAAVVVAGAFSLSRAAALGLQWCAITAVCLGSLLLLLALIGAAGARLRNRFSLLGFAALEAAVAVGLLLSGTWCLALAGGSATLSDFTWEAMSQEVSRVLGLFGRLVVVRRCV